MKKYCFLFCAFLLVACDTYTVKNDSGEDVIVGDVVIAPSECKEFVDFLLIGDFPLQFKDKDDQLLSEEEFSAGHYVILTQGKVYKQNSACPMKTEKQTKIPPPAMNPNRTHPDPHPSSGLGPKATTNETSHPDPPILQPETTPAPTGNRVPVLNDDRILGPPTLTPDDSEDDSEEEEKEKKKRSGRGTIQQ